MKLFRNFTALILIWACTEEKTPVNPPTVSVGKEQALNFGDLGLSATVIYPSAPLDSVSNSYLVFNPFSRSLDTLKFKENELFLTAGLELPFEGPSGIPDFNFFTSGKSGPIFLDGNQFYFPKDGEIQKVNFGKELSKNGSFISVFGGDQKNKSYRFSEIKGDFLAVVTKDFESRTFSLAVYDFFSESFKIIPFSFPLNQMNAHRIAFEQGPMMVENSYFPFLNVYDSTLVISYPFFNQISTLSLNNQTQKDFDYESKLFKTVKDLPEQKAEPLDLKTYLEVSSAWNSDINYGSVLRLNQELYFRVVEEQNSQRVFLELFSRDFKKLGEYDLTAIEPNLGTFHLPFDGKILFGSSKKESEDTFYYHWVSVDQEFDPSR